MAETAQQPATNQAASMLKVQGIISAIFGGIGVLGGLIMMVIFALALGNAYTDNDIVGYAVLFGGSILFVLIPHIYLIIAGVILVRQPEPKLARLLTIINLIVGAMSNYVVLAFAIISLTQTKEYEEGYKLEAK